MTPIPIKLVVSESTDAIALEIKDTNLEYKISGAVPIITNVYPDYSGICVVTPSNDTQILNTTDKILRSDIVIEAIPQNYGLITWNGAFLTVS